ncbi:MAG: PQQ-binding-like beta-propeller repeat protein [Actinomycetota bacterium]
MGKVLIGAVAAALAAVLGACGGGGGPSPSAGNGAGRGDGPAADGGGSSSGGARKLSLDERWAWAAPPPAGVGRPAADSEGAAVVAGLRRLVLVDGRGRQVWLVERSRLRDVAPALTPDLVVAATEEALVAYDRASGRPRWELEVGERPNSPVVAGDRVVVTTWEGSLVAADLATGRQVWKVPLGGASFGPAAARGTSVVATFDTGRAAGVMAVDLASGRQRWSVPVPPDGVSAPAVTAAGGGRDPLVVAVVGDATARALSLADGSERWRREMVGAGSSEVPPLALADGSVLAAHRLGGMAQLAEADGAVLWEAHVASAADRGAPAGPGPQGWFALPLVDGPLLLAGPGLETTIYEADGAVTGVALGPGGLLLVATRAASENYLSAVEGW